MPPARSGIADYSFALVDELKHIADVHIFSSAPSSFYPARFDHILYQIGNNADHDFVYEQALRTPGAVVLHEANLHHLITDVTIRRGLWDEYVAECAFDGGEPARLFAEKVRTLAVGPDYDAQPMLRRILSRSSAVIAHSEFVAARAREAGFTGPIGVIPHGAWVDGIETSEAHHNARASMRHRLGVDGATYLIGAFGYLKPYKRIGETLRALRRLVRLQPRVKMILGGEPHPEFPIVQMIRTLGLEDHVRLLGFTPIEDFAGYIAACDAIVNLRFPTVGESSGSLLRAFSAGKPALVSDVGAFSELPDDVCLKVPVGTGEEDVIFEYLNLLSSQPSLGRTFGARARDWVETECSWRIVARRYLNFLEGETEPKVLPTHTEPANVAATPEDVLAWPANPAARDYVEGHVTRLVHTLNITPPGDASKSILEMGAYLQITPALKLRLGYGNVRGCYFGPAGRTDIRQAISESGEVFECPVDLFDAERDVYPYPDASFDTVLCCELIEHLAGDPMFLMSEVNRILKDGGHLVLTTPNAASLRAVSAIIEGYHPGFFASYIKPNEGGEADARHNREYAPREIKELLQNSGFEVTHLETGEFRDQPHPEYAWARALLAQHQFDTNLRGEGIYIVGRKTGPIRDRWPKWLYA